MLPLNLELDLELNSDVDKVASYLFRLLQNRQNHPAAYNKLIPVVQQFLQPILPTPASTPREEPDPDGQADQHKNNLVDPHDHSSLAASQEGQPLFRACVEDADDSSVEQTSDDSQLSANLNVWPPFDHNSDTYNKDARQEKKSSEPTITSSISQRLDTPQYTFSTKRKQHFDDGGASKRAHIELADATEGGLGSSNTGYPARWTYEEFASRYYMLVPSSSRTSDVRDMANKILTRVFGAYKGEGLDKYQLGLTEIFSRADMLAFLEKLRTTRLNYHATMIQKNLKAKYYRCKYLEARNAILVIQSVTRRHLAWKYAQETREILAATTIQRVWRGQKQRKSFNAIRNHIILTQAAAKGFLQRRAILDIHFGKAAVLIQRLWRLRREYKRKVVIVQNLWRGKCARRTCEKIREVDRIAELPPHWRTQLQRIKSREVLEDCQHFCYMIRHPVTSIDIRPDQDALERSGGPDKIPTRDRRLKQVKFILEDGWAKEKSFDIPKIVLQISRRIHLVELTARYMEDIEAEKATSKKWRTKAKKTASKKRRQPTVKERYVDLLFPLTINYKGKKARRRKKCKKVRDRKGQQVSGEEVREKAEKRFEYFIRLGKPLWKMSECYGLSILAILPKEVTETSLFTLALGKNQDQDVVDYIDLCHPGLKEQISNLSTLLPSIIAGGLPSKRLMIETLPHHELSDHAFEELFQFSNDRDPSQPPQEHINEQSLYAQDAVESTPSISPDCTSKILQSPFLSINTEDGNLSNSPTNYNELAQLPASQSNLYQELDQEFSSYMEDSSSFHQSAQLQPDHSEGPVNSQDSYYQDIDWRAQPSSACERECLDSHGNALQRAGPSNTESSDLDSVINYSPTITSSIASPSLTQSRGLDLAAHLMDVPPASEPDVRSRTLIDTWQNEGRTDCMMAWTAHNQEARTVDPRELVQAPV